VSCRCHLLVNSMSLALVFMFFSFYVFLFFWFFFFFSSRRRHTRFKCDWSSDVCSSDLISTARCSVFSSSRTLPGQRLVVRTRLRSEERRVGKECRSRWWPEHEKKKKRRKRKWDREYGKNERRAVKVSTNGRWTSLMAEE